MNLNFQAKISLNIMKGFLRIQVFVKTGLNRLDELNGLLFVILTHVLNSIHYFYKATY